MKSDLELPLISGGQQVPAKDQNAISPKHPKPYKPSFEFRKVTNYFRYLSYMDMFPIFKRMNMSKNPITLDSLPAPYEAFNVEEKMRQLDRYYQEESHHQPEQRSLTQPLLKSYSVEIYTCLLLCIGLCFSFLFSSLFLNNIMRVVTSTNLGDDSLKDDMIYYAILYTFLTSLNSALDHWFNYNAISLGGNMRLALTGLVYKKINTVTLSSLNTLNIGKIINILSNNMSDLEDTVFFSFPTVIAPLNVLLSCYLLWDHFGIFSVISLCCQGLIMAITVYLANLSKTPKSELNTIADARIKNTNEFIENIRLIKLYAWEKPFRKVIEDLRDKEQTLLKKIGIIDAIGMTIAGSSLNICILITLTAYVWNGGILSPEGVYTMSIILNFTNIWVTIFFRLGRMYIIGARLTKERLEEVLRVDEVMSSHNRRSIYYDQEEPSIPNIMFRNFTAYWSKEVETPCLDNITTQIDCGKTTIIIGKIQSGKTSLLLSFLREIPNTSGELSFKGTIAYVEQEPTVFSDSIRENILFGQEFDEKFYKIVLKACNLTEDLKQFDHGDQTIIGERGVTISGGQKARISLARALYSRSDIYLLDDPLSAVDSHVGKIIFEKAIKGVLKNKTVILVTHHLSYAKEADKVIVMDKGKITAEGKFDSLLNMNIDLVDLFIMENSEQKEEVIPDDNKPPVNHRKASAARNHSSFSDSGIVLSDEKQTIAGEDTTTVTWSTYIKFLKESDGYRPAAFILALIFMRQGGTILFTNYIGYWAQLQNEFYHNFSSPIQDEEQFDNSPFFLMSVFATVIHFFSTFGLVITTIRFLLNTNTRLHAKMLYKISRSVIPFFDNTPIGQVLNRFSNDLGTLDKSTIMIVIDLIVGIIYHISLLLFLCFVNYILVIPSLLVLFLFYKITMFYTFPGIELRRSDLASRSPIYSEISSTLNGLLIIRVYHQGNRFVRNFTKLLYNSSKAYLANVRGSRLFGVLLDFALFFLKIGGIYFFIYIAYNTNIEAGVFGVSLYYLITIYQSAIWSTRQTIFLRLNMQSAQRIQDFCELTEEAPEEIPDTDSQLSKRYEHWPKHGKIEFQNVYLRYQPSFPFVLTNLNFSVEAGTKVAIVGRTGAGKSSIIQVLFRLAEIQQTSNSWIKIDDVNTKDLGLEFLRKNLSILPQTPVIFAGTIRRNLDPLSQYSERQLWEVLEQVNLKNYVESFQQKLDTDMSDSSSVFSTGQKQLLCLARVILRRSKIVVLDEATANVDIDTDNFIQEQIKVIFKECTIITIAHRLTTIAHYDKILVLNQGQMVEHDHPYKLLVNHVGDNEITNKEGLFAQMVLKNGEQTAMKIFKTAYSTFANNQKQEY